ncbi:helix-turn-helix transcriptional regulator [Saccharopolyspora sp. NPDC049426]|uniref:helix-turn-helix domain-containing protein n=1 Tax=Saccharopolyspora sp. NPDC049426 TaxID=3155652 RepID=UPI003437B3EA
MVSESFGQVLRRYRAAAGLSQPQLARKVHADQSAVSRWENDRTTPGRETVERLDELLDAGGGLTSAALPAAPAPLQPVDQPVTCGDVQALRNTIAHLVGLDGQHGGAELLPLAARTFRTASARLATGNYAASLEPDFTATVAELGEVAGWLAFDAMQHDKARSFNLEALHLARLAGDVNMELFLLGNMALLAQETGQAREALRTVELMERFPLSPRLRVMAALRRARAAADLGDERALALIQQAQSQVDESLTDADPEWSWWVDRRELVMHEGSMWRAVGRLDRAVDRYAEALEAVPDAYRWSAYIGGSWLVAALVEARSWSEAETAANELARLAPEVSSRRASQRLREAVTAAKNLRGPSSLEGLLSALVSN